MDRPDSRGMEEETDLLLTHPVEAVLLDIEGTVTPISMVRDRLFPYARARLADYLAEHADEPTVREVLAETRALAPEADPVASLARIPRNAGVDSDPPDEARSPPDNDGT